MIRIVVPLATLWATPLLAHDGMHLHPHADHPAWSLVMLASAVVGVAAYLAWRRR
ncbi:MAG: peptidase M23 [Paracoccaceae bacterium]|jgi:hypothetical protein|nr:peptidase M23 [Paracoccaceae bacterium]